MKKTLILALIYLSSGFKVYAEQRQNIVMLMVDDLSNELYQEMIEHNLLPNIKKYIVDRGLNFNNSFVTNPACCPSRATYLTGQYSMNNGVLDVATGIQYWHNKKSDAYGGEENILPVWMKKGGYYTGHIGKYLNGYGQNTLDTLGTLLHVPSGYDTWYGLLDPSTYNMYNYVMIEKRHPEDQPQAIYYPKNVATKMNEVSYPTYWLFKNSNNIFKVNKPNNYRENPYKTIEENYQTDVITKKALKFFNDRDPNKPFFLSLMPIAPHVEFPAIEELDIDELGYKFHFRESVTPAPRHNSLVSFMPSPVNRLLAKDSFNEKDLTDKPKFFKDKKPLDYSDIAAIDNQYRHMMAAMLAVDDMVGEVVKKLKQQNQFENTIIFFTSDNGYMFGEHRLSTKGVPYDESARVPLVVAGYDEAGTTCDAIVLNNDLAPTIAAIAKVKPERKVDGRSFKKLLMNKDDTWNRKQFLIEHYLDMESLSYVSDIPLLGPWLVDRVEKRTVNAHLIKQLDIPTNDTKSIRRITDVTNELYIETYNKKLFHSRFKDRNTKKAPKPQFVELYNSQYDPFQAESIVPGSKSMRKAWQKKGAGKFYGDLIDQFVKCSGKSCQQIENQ
jgi:arylsulfatase A-like enzyme